MIFGPVEILICIVPVFVLIATVGILLALQNRSGPE
jgi:hypothetical protein